jgi:hypothetical protein
MIAVKVIRLMNRACNMPSAIIMIYIDLIYNHAFLCVNTSNTAEQMLAEQQASV